METKSFDLPLILPLGAECSHCVHELGGEMLRIRGVRSVDTDVARGLVRVGFDGGAVTVDELAREARRAGAITHCADHCPFDDHSHPHGEHLALLPDEHGYEQRLVHVTGLDCADCALKLEGSLRREAGVVDAGVSFGASTLKVTYDPAVLGIDDVLERVHRHGYDSLERQQARRAGPELVFTVDGMDCGDCATRLERRLARIDGVASVTVDFGLARLTAVAASAASPEAALAATAAGMGYRLTPAGAPRAAPMSFWRRPRTVATILSGVFVLAGFVAELTLPAAAPWLFAVAMVLGGASVARAAAYALRARQVDMNVLMTLAAVGAAAIGQWSEAGLVVFLFALGNLLQSLTMERTRRAVTSLLDLEPDQASVLRDGGERLLPLAAVAVGDVVVVRPGERVPVDGEVVDGSAACDQSAITGESLPVARGPGDRVFAGAIVQGGRLEVRTTSGPGDNTIARIIHLVEEAQAERAPLQSTVDRFAARYTPVVVTLAALVAVIPPVVFGQPFATWFYRALALLIISCPCALVISTPVSIISALGAATRRGVLIKGGVYLEQARRLRALAVDKTGTLTEGRPRVTDVVALDGAGEPDGGDGHDGGGADDGLRRRVLALAAAVERFSEHPLAQAVVSAADGDAGNLAVTRFRALAGAGARADVDGHTIIVGKPDLFAAAASTAERERIAAFEGDGKTVVAVGTPERLLGLIAIADTVRPDARDALDALRRQGVERIVLLTGDNPVTAAAIAGQAGADEALAELLPEQKVDAVRRLHDTYGTVGMLGDGVNDAPALAAADLGIAMGAAGTDAAIESADIALMGDDLGALADTLALSRRTGAVIRENIAFSIAVKAVFIVLAPLGLITLWMAVFADMGTSLAVTANGMRLRSALRHD